MLKPINPDQEGPAPAPVACEACHKQIARRDLAINLIITIGSPGHPELPPIQCPQEEHWACSPECWAAVAHACIDEHMQSTLKKHRAKVGLE